MDLFISVLGMLIDLAIEKLFSNTSEEVSHGPNTAAGSRSINETKALYGRQSM